MTKPSIAVILSGCGHRDGSEIQEATLTLWAIHKHGANYQCYAPDITQHHVLDHISGKEMDESRNVFAESARICRGKLKKLNEFDSDCHDALIIPGGLGAVKNLCSYAFEGNNFQVNTEVEDAIRSMVEQNKPIGALCIAPVILARLLNDITVTVGNSTSTASRIEAMGAIHQQASATGIVVDRKNKIVSTPCYMYDSRVDEIGEGAEKVVQEILKMTV